VAVDLALSVEEVEIPVRGQASDDAVVGDLTASQGKPGQQCVDESLVVGCGG